jgi:GNAT superfamily N-acetyltransferase
MEAKAVTHIEILDGKEVTVYEMRSDQLKEDYLNVLREHYDERIIEKVKARHQDPAYGKTYYYAFYGEKLVAGCAVLTFQPNIFGISGMAVSKKYQRQNVATLLMACIHECHKGIFLLSSSKAAGFYQKFGYENYKETKYMAKFDEDAVWW